METETTERISCGRCCKGLLGNHWKGMMSIIIPLLFSPILLISFDKGYRCLWLVCVMAVFWITEAFPLYITSLLPIIFFPAFGILDSEETCSLYFKNPLVMFLAGLMVALAIEFCNLHKRLALRVILIVGCSPRKLHVGLLSVATFISMWISNAATAAMMCPIIRAVLEELSSQGLIDIYMEETEDKEKSPNEPKHPSRIAMAYYFGASYASTIGGCGTIIGTGTNITFIGIYETRFPQSTDAITFPIFMAYCVPFMLVNTVVMIAGLQITHMGLFRANSKESKEIERAKTGEETARSFIAQRYAELGPLSVHEVQVIILFVLMVVLLFTQKPGFMTGWADLFPAKKVKNSAPVVFIVLLIFYLPANYLYCKICCGREAGVGPFPLKQTPSIMTWKFLVTQTPWGLVFLLGGGYVLAAGITASGMAKMIANWLNVVKDFPPSTIQLMSIIAGIFFTAFSSNVAICNILMPILAELAVAIKIHPLLLIFPTGLACSMAYHLPVSTPPNAIVAGYANIKSKYMACAGIIPTVCGVVTLFINGQTWHNVLYPASNKFPDWAAT